MEKVLKGSNATQATAHFFLEMTPEDLEQIAKELRGVKHVPGQEIIKKISPSVTIIFRPDLSTKAYEIETGKPPMIGSGRVPANADMGMSNAHC